MSETRTATYEQLGRPLFYGWCLARLEDGNSFCCVPEDVFAEWKERGFEGAVSLEWVKSGRAWSLRAVL